MRMLKWRGRFEPAAAGSFDFVGEGAMDNTDPRKRNTPVFDFVVLLGMVVNLILAVFLILYYFDFF